MKTYLRNKAGKFKKRYITRNVKVASCIILGGVLLFTGLTLRSEWETRVWSYGVNVAEASELRFDGLEAAKDAVLDELIKCESGGRTDLITYDPDKSGKDYRIPSFGQLQFKVPTVQHYHKKMTGEELGVAEAVAVAFDVEKSRKLAKWVIFSSGRKIDGDWFNCSKWHGLVAKVELIKSLEQ